MPFALLLLEADSSRTTVCPSASSHRSDTAGKNENKTVTALPEIQHEDSWCPSSNKIHLESRSMWNWNHFLNHPYSITIGKRSLCFACYRQSYLRMFWCWNLASSMIFAMSWSQKQLEPCVFPSLLPSFLRSFVPSFLSSFLPFFLSSFLPSFVPSFLPSPVREYFFDCNNIFFDCDNIFLI